MARYFIIFLFSFTLTSCSFVEPYFLVMRGNYQFSGGEYQRSLVDYLRAQRPNFQPWIHYNLGNLYWSLGETQSALRVWQSAEQISDTSIQFAVSFNRGILYFEQGMYSQSYDEFKNALVFDPSNIDAKINLELALAKLQAGNQLSISQKKSDVNATPEAESIRILEYMKRKEKQQWQKREKEVETFSESTSDW